MDTRLFFSTFLLIFLAELGDKTQLASMAASAGSKAPWSVFAGASVALVLSTLLAVLLGSTLQRLIPPQWLKGGAAILFFAFGAVLLVSALRPAGEFVERRAKAAGGAVAGFVFDAAAQFELAAAGDYDRMAAETNSPAVRELFLHLAAEERQHLDRVSQLKGMHGDDTWPALKTSPSTDVLPRQAPVDAAVKEALEHELATARFYRELARVAPLASVRTAFLQLAEEEDSHVAHLREFSESGTTRV